MNQTKLLKATAIYTIVGVFSLTVALFAQNYEENSNRKKIIGRWKCEGKTHGKIATKGNMTFDSNNKVYWNMAREIINDDINLSARIILRGKFRVDGNLVSLYESMSSTENLSSKAGNNYEQNVELRKAVGQYLPEYKSQDIHKTDDTILEISAISDKHLIIQPEGGGSSELICRK